MIYYTPNTGWTWLVTLIAPHRKGIYEIYEEHGEAGIYYVLAFGIIVSPQSNEMDLDLREKLVLDEIKLRGIKSGKSKGKFPRKLYDTDTCKLAIDEANTVACTPDWKYKHNLELQLKQYQNQLNAGNFEKDPEVRAKSLEADTKAFNLVTKYRAELRIEETHTNKMVSKSGQIGLDDLFE